MNSDEPEPETETDAPSAEAAPSAKSFWFKMVFVGPLLACVIAVIVAIALYSYVLPTWEDSHVQRDTERRWHEREAAYGSPSQFDP